MARIERAPALRTLLSERDFRLLLAAQYLAQCADGIAQAAFAEEIVLDPTSQNTPGRILALFALTLLPYSVVAPFLGVFVDRWDRRALLVGTNLLRFALLLSLPLWMGSLSGDAGLYVALLALLGLGRLFLVTKGAALPVVLHEHHLLDGNALSAGGGMISALVGGVAGLAGLSGIDVGWVFALAGLLYAVSSGIARLISHPMARHEPALEGLREAVSRIARELMEGIAEVWSRNAARLPLAGIFVLRTSAMLTAIAAILVIKDAFPQADRVGRLSTSALALGAAGVGAFAGAVVAPHLGRRLNRPGLILCGFAISGVGIVALGGVVAFWALLTLTFLGGLGNFVAKVATDAQVQASLPDAFRGRAFALYDILYNAASVAAALVMFAVEGASLRLVLPGAGVVTLLLAGALGVAMRRAGLLVAARASEPTGA
ncbi:MAG: MFS transporter [Actinomycetota bacterium]